MCVVGDYHLHILDHNKPVNDYSEDPKAGSKQACIADAAVVYDKHEMVQIFIFLINQVIEMKGLDHHCLFPMQYCMNGVVINEVPRFLGSVFSETMHAIQVSNPFDAAHPVITSLQIIKAAEYDHSGIIKVELMAEAVP